MQYLKQFLQQILYLSLYLSFLGGFRRKVGQSFYETVLGDFRRTEIVQVTDKRVTEKFPIKNLWLLPRG